MNQNSQGKILVAESDIISATWAKVIGGEDAVKIIPRSDNHNHYVSQAQAENSPVLVMGTGIRHIPLAYLTVAEVVLAKTSVHTVLIPMAQQDPGREIEGYLLVITRDEIASIIRLIPNRPQDFLASILGEAKRIKARKESETCCVELAGE